MRIEFEIRAPRWWRNWRTRRYYKHHPVPPGGNDFQLFESVFENVELISEEQKEHKS